MVSLKVNSNSKQMISSKSVEYNEFRMKLTLISIKICFSALLIFYLILYEYRSLNHLFANIDFNSPQIHSLLQKLISIINVLFIYVVFISTVVYICVVNREYAFGIAFMTGYSVWEILFLLFRSNANLLVIGVTIFGLICFILLALDFCKFIVKNKKPELGFRPGDVCDV